VAEWLDSLGAPPGVAVPALLAASGSSIALLVAGALWDRPVAPLGPRLTTDELAACVRGLDARLLVTEREFLPAAEAVAKRAGVAVAVLPETVGRVDRGFDPGVAPDAVALVQHTSGTTGLPKQVVVSQGRLGHRVDATPRVLEFGVGDSFTTAGGFHHAAGAVMFLIMLAAGGSVIPMRHFSIDEWRALDARRPSHALAVPSQIEMLLRADALVLPSLTLLQYGASPIHPDTLRAALAALPATRFVQVFGQTEGSPLTALTHEDHLRALRGEPGLLASAGRAVADLELALDLDAAPDDPEVGEVRARAAHLFAPGPDGWLATGDLGRIDAEGYLYLVGRLGDMLIRGGENVYPLEVERVLEQHPGVVEAAVYGVPDRRLGQEIAAAVVAVGGMPPSAEELTVWCRERLAPFKVPREWVFLDALPRTASGKLLRRALA
jgi:acyl-CoA synthetase (AMP-forming)/AMP-acid ligase II